MFTQQPYHLYAQHSKGTLVTGQTIPVNKYTVRVEQYLSQGGFAQVYLVRTQTPVYNTTHHVLKHIVVADESMLIEVKKEVDVMRLLRGHPNIVYLIDAAWAKMPSGAFEVYILMEYCPGGGVIDMMNRRLRERLSETEVLQMFVEVCEGVAHMHNSRPPLLHRDLKVENILQSSATSFKLCDFGSTTTVSRPPANSQEMRALEFDLNHHTTLQYRAPEMIDLPSRRPIDEKSDVWALGVLLYKLCYYTTPFEEHGPLAILNVQYKFPAYPVYSQKMTHLISSMLQEHGSQRPTVFEVLHNVHSMRGTKSAYSYSLPTLKPLALQNSDFKSNPLDGIVTYRQSTTQNAPKVQSTKAPEFLVSPGRRGRPKSTTDLPSLLSFPPINPVTDTHIDKLKLVDDVGAHRKAAWSSVIAEQTSLSPVPPRAGSDDNFAQRLWASTASSIVNQSSVPTPSFNPRICSPKLAPLYHDIPSSDKSKHDLNIQVNQGKDAFEGLDLMIPVLKSAQTLGETRKSHTGLATVSVNISRSIRPSPSPRLRPKIHTQHKSPIPPARSLETDISSPSSRLPIEQVSSSVQTKFPTLEELDATFPPGVSSLQAIDRHHNRVVLSSHESPTLSPQPKTGSLGTGANNAGGTRSKQVTGLGMWESEDSSSPLDLLSFKTDGRDERNSLGLLQFPSFDLSRTQLQKERGSQCSVGSGDIKSRNITNFRLPANSPTDLLTGDDELDLSRQISDSKSEHDTLKIRETPRKRASVIEQNDTFKATIPQQGHAPDPPASVFPLTSNQSTVMKLECPTSRFMRELPAIDRSATATVLSSGLTDNWSPIATTGSRAIVNEKDKTLDLSSSEDEGPEEPAPLPSLPPRIAAEALVKHKSRQGSVHNLVDLWEGGASNTKDKQHEPQLPLKQTNRLRSAYMPQPRSPSPQHKSLSSVSLNPTHSVISSRVDLPPQLSTSPLSSWSESNKIRPQSMFIFPTSSAESSAPSSAALQPPEDTAPHSVRRTSISDMVQRYEALEASARVTGNSTISSPINSAKLLPSREYSQDSPAVQVAKTSPEKATVPLPGSSTTAANSLLKRRTSLTVLPRPGSSRSQRIFPNSPNAPSSASLEEGEVGTIVPRPRKSSILISESIQFPVASRKAGERSMRQTQLEPLTTTSYPTDERPSSPERPYQGVGKLIDQWQRKSAEAEASRSVLLSKRTSLAPPKQAGLVPAHGKGM